MAFTIRSLLVRLGVQADTPAVKSFDRAIDGAKQRMERASKAVGTLQVALGNLAANAITSAVSATRELLSGIVESNVAYESLTARLETVLGSQEAAAAAMAKVSEFAKATPFQIQGITEAYIQLLRKGIEPTTSLLTHLGDVASANGRQIEDVMKGVNSLVSTGTQEIIEGVTGLQWSVKGNKIIVENLDGTKTELKRTTGAVVAYIDALGQTQGIAGGMERQSKTLGGAFSNLKDAFFSFSVEVGKAGFSDALADFARAFSSVETNGVNVAEVLGQTLARAVRALTELLIWTAGHLREIGSLFRWVAAGATILAAVKIGVWLSSIIPLLTNMRTTLIGLRIALSSLSVQMGIVFGAFAALGFIIYDLVKFARGEDSLIGDLIGDDERRVNSLRSALLSVWETIKEAWVAVQPALDEIGQALAELGQTILDELGVEPVDILIAALLSAAEVVKFLIKVATGLLFILMKVATFVIKVGTVLVRGISWAIDQIKLFFRALAWVLAKIVDKVTDDWATFAHWYKEKVVKPLEAAWKAIGEWIDTHVIQPSKDAIEWMIEKFEWLKKKSEELVRGVKGIADNPENTAFDVTDALGITDSISMGAVAHGQLAQLQREGVVSNVSTGDINVTIQGSTNMDAGQVSNATGQGVTQGLGDTFKAAERQLGGG